MIPLLAVLLAAGPVGPANPKPSQAQFESCVAQSDTDPAGAIAGATAWWKANGGVPAGQCLGISYAAAGAWKSAAAAFSDAAELAVENKDGRAANLWVSAGNAALAGGDIARAKVALNSAIALPVMSPVMRGEAYLDLARANVAAGELPDARTAMEQALKLVSADPMAWLLSATLARRMGDTARAQADISQADDRAPHEAPILFEQGNIFAAAGDLAKARDAWTKARAIAPQSEAGQAAAKELASAAAVIAGPPGTATPAPTQPVQATPPAAAQPAPAPADPAPAAQTPAEPAQSDPAPVHKKRVPH